MKIDAFGANRYGSMLVEPILDAVPAIKRGGRGHPAGRSSCTRPRPILTDFATRLGSALGLDYLLPALFEALHAAALTAA